MAAGPFEVWVKGLRISWLKGAKAQAIMGALARIQADLSVAWAENAQQQHFPQLADAEALPLIGSERRLPQGPTESNADYALRLTYAITLWKRAGTPIGLLLALYYEGFGGLVLVQQNGRAYELADPDVVSPVQTITALGGNPNLDDHPWWTFDDNDEYCSRFALLLPAGVGWAVRVGWAVFTGAEDGSAVPWPVATFAAAFADTTYLTMCGSPLTVDGAVVVATLEDATKTISQITVAASAPFVGRVPVLAWPVGENPFANISSSDLARLRRIIRDWKPAKARCMGLYVLVRGRFWGWPVRAWGDGLWDMSEVVSFEMES